MDSTHETTAELFTSRPAPEERLEKELLCYDLLENTKSPTRGWTILPQCPWRTVITPTCFWGFISVKIFFCATGRRQTFICF